MFTSDPKSRENSLPKDRSREDEIARKEHLREAHLHQTASPGASTPKTRGSVKIPKRLRGIAVGLVRQLQNRNRRCSTKELLRYYCPEQDACPWALGPLSAQETSVIAYKSSSSTQLITQLSATRKRLPTSQLTSVPLADDTRTTVTEPKVNLTDYATPVAAVSGFCKAVIRNLIPLEFFGTGEQGHTHKQSILVYVDRFIRLRRFESLSLDEVCKNIKVTQIPWLAPQSLRAPAQSKISLSDLEKRKELFFEFIYYLFTSILMPLIRGNFYVTESQLHRNRLFYFRHDVWRRITTQPLENLKASMFEELNTAEAEKILRKRTLGYGSLRLLPKAKGTRPILNLKRRSVLTSSQAGKNQQQLGPSVNSTIAPIHGMLDYERRRRSHLLGVGMSSVGDIYLRLRAFKESLVAKGWNKKTPLYFVKLDIQSCFDTIPQHNLVRLIESLVPEEAYHHTKYVAMRPGNEFGCMWQQGSESAQSKTLRRYLGRASASPEHIVDSAANGGVPGRRNTVFVDTIKQRDYSSTALLDLLDAHVRNNLVKIGKRYFRQRKGIPQGSVISTLLCNLFYAEMEKDVLGFLQSDDTLLLRLIDDFLLVTLDSGVAMQFLQVMLKGQPAYGVSVNPAKSLVNFAAAVNGAQIPRLVDTSLFPYCGSLVDTKTLEIFKDQDRILDGAESVTAALTDSLSIEPSRAPGRSFHRKVLASVKLTMHPMYRYTRSLPCRARPRPEVVIRTISDVIQLGYRMVRGRHGLCTVTAPQMQYLGAAAFQFVLGRKQTRYVVVLRWLDGTLEEAWRGLVGNSALLGQVVRRGNVTYGGWRF